MCSLAENLRGMSLIGRLYTIEAPTSDARSFDGKRIAPVTMTDARALIRTSRKQLQVFVRSDMNNSKM